MGGVQCLSLSVVANCKAALGLADGALGGRERCYLQLVQSESGFPDKMLPGRSHKCIAIERVVPVSLVRYFSQTQLLLPNRKMWKGNSPRVSAGSRTLRWRSVVSLLLRPSDFQIPFQACSSSPPVTCIAMVAA